MDWKVRKRQGLIWGQEEAGLDLGSRDVSGEGEEGIKEITIRRTETLN